MKRFTFFIFLFLYNAILLAQDAIPPDTITVLSDGLKLKGLLCHPARSGTFPAIIFCHGSYQSNDDRYDAVRQCSILGPVFASKGYIFLVLFRRGIGLSSQQGENSADLM